MSNGQLEIIAIFYFFLFLFSYPNLLRGLASVV